MHTPEDDPVIAAGDELLMLPSVIITVPMAPTPVEVHLTDLPLVTPEDGELDRGEGLTSNVTFSLPQHSCIVTGCSQVPEMLS